MRRLVDFIAAFYYIYFVNSKYIYKQATWPAFKWDAEKLASPLAETRHKQGRLLGQMEGLGFNIQDETNLAVLTSEIIKSSAIEGQILNTNEVRSSLAHRLGIDIGGMTSTSRAVEGVVEMMLDATQNYKDALTTERLQGWQAALFPTGYSGLRKIAIGAWRTPEVGPMQVVSGPAGREKVHFQAPEAESIPHEMGTFLSWINSEPEGCPVIKAGLAHLWFVTIHPFEDGNGRIARAITEMLLTRSDGTPHRFYSMSFQIESERKKYYDTLEETQKGSLDVSHWLMWFIGCLSRSLESAQNALEKTLNKARIWQVIDNARVNDRQRKVINRLLDDFKGDLTSSKYAKMTKCSSDTALRDIKELLARGILLQNDGKGRSVSYRLGSLTSIT